MRAIAFHVLLEQLLCIQKTQGEAQRNDTVALLGETPVPALPPLDP